MTDFYCPECKKDIARSALACPSCGAQPPSGGWPEKWFSKTLREQPLVGWPLALVGLGVFGLMLYGGLMLIGAIWIAIFH
ncbi:MAG: zinc ribbon domain-containing protein [Acidobacteriaceae bacterium]